MPVLGLRAPLAACTIALAAAAGCGSTDEDEVRATIETLEQALRDEDPRAVCGLYAEDRQFCRKVFGLDELRSVGFGGEIEVIDVEIDGDRAVARVENVRGSRRVGGRTELRKVGDHWLLEPPGGG